MPWGFASTGAGTIDAIAAGSQTASTGTVVFSNSNNVTFGMTNNSVVTASAAQVAFSAGTNLVSNGTVQFSNANGVSFGLNGSTLTASVVPGALTLSKFNTRDMFDGGINQAASYLTLQRIFVPANITATQIRYVRSISGATNATGAVSLSVAVYTMSGSTASQVSSTNATTSWSSSATTNSTSNSTIYGGVSGLRLASISLASWAFTPGEYLLAFVANSANATFSPMGISGAAMSGFTGGANFSATQAFDDGVYSVGTTGCPASIHRTDVLQANTLVSFANNNMVPQPNWCMFGTN